MTIHLIDHLVFLFLAVLFPIWDYLYIRKQRRLIEAGRVELRITFYRRTILEEWVMALVLLGVWFGLGRNPASLGLVPQGGWLVWAGYGLTLLTCVFLILQAEWIMRSPEHRDQIRNRLKSLSFVLPHTPHERRVFDAVSITAGVCEEVIYRGYLIAYVMALLDTPFWVAALLSSVVFGLAHAYQGPVGIPRTAFVGSLLALLYWMTGSLWAPIVVHAVVDITSGRVAFASFRERTDPARSAFSHCT